MEEEKKEQPWWADGHIVVDPDYNKGFTGAFDVLAVLLEGDKSHG